MLKRNDTPEPAGAEPPTVAKARPVLRRVLHLIPLVPLVAAGMVLWREFRHLSFSEIAMAMGDWGYVRVAGAVALAAFSFWLMGVVEWLGLRWAGVRVPWIPSIGVSFLANAIAHAVGANLLVSGALRARLYDRYGVSLAQVAATTLFGGMSFAVGIGMLGGCGLALSPPEQITATAIPLGLARLVGWGLISASAGYVVLCALRRAPLRAFGRRLALPSAGAALGQLVVGVVDNGVAAAIIWMLLPAGDVPYQTFVGAYAVAAVAGLVSTVPAGAGVFEGSISTLLPQAEGAPLAAAFLGYRLAYYLLPLIVACAALAIHTLRRRAA